VRLLANPMFLRAAMVLFFSAFAFLLGLYLIRKLRENIALESNLSTEHAGSIDTLQMHVYNTVIQQLKQQKRDLQVETKAEQQRANSHETFSQTLLSNLSCGLLIFGANGLVKNANPAAKSLLGFASITGMSAEDIFRDGAAAGGPGTTAVGEEAGQEPVWVKDEIAAALRQAHKRQVNTDYRTPAGERRYLSLTLAPLPALEGSQTGITCVINDCSELERIREQQHLQGEIAAEMAERLRASLTTISGLAQQLATNRDPRLGEELATDIAQEAAQLDHSIGGFLSTRPLPAAIAAGSASK
jgi:nitrogen fixation/metabolism regulation signal transduction histidine kinase